MKELPVSTSVIIGSLLISISILVSGGVIKFKTPELNINKPAASLSPSASLDEKLATLAKSQKLDEGKFKSCLSSKKYQDEINKDQTDAQAAGITGTPGFIVGKSTSDGKIEGIRITGAYPLAVFTKVFDQLQQGSELDAIISGLEGEYPTGLEKGSASLDNDPILGDKNAPVALIEFSDYECPFCKRHFTQTLPSLRKDYIDTGKVKLIYRDFIAVPSHNPAATTEALAAECVKEIGGDLSYFKFHDELFTRTQANGAGI